MEFSAYRWLDELSRVVIIYLRLKSQLNCNAADKGHTILGLNDDDV